MAELSPRAIHQTSGRRQCMGLAPAAGKIPVVEATAHGKLAERHRSKSGLEKNQLARQRSIESTDTEEIG